MEIRPPLSPPPAALIFDCDGTIADSMPLHIVAWRDTLARWGGKLDEKLFYDWAGMSIAAIVTRINSMQAIQLPLEEFVRAREEAYFALLSQVRGIPYVMERIARGAAQGLPMAVVSGSPRDSVLKTLETLGIADRFGTIIGAGDIARGKPAPDGFLLAAERLGVEPGRCLVFEDADYGVQAAQAAGMAWVRIPSAAVPKAIAETPRFWLREMHADDAEALFELNSDPQVVRYTGDGAWASLEAARAFLASYPGYGRNGMGRWAVISRATGEYMGWCGLKKLESGEVDLGYRLARRHWGQGIATETSRAVIAHAFGALGLGELIATVMPENRASAQVLAKLGFARVGDAMIGDVRADKYLLKRG